MAHRTTIRAATSTDVPELVTLCLAARAEAGTGSALCTDDAARLRDQITTALGLPGALVLVAANGTQVDGMLLGRTVGPALFLDEVVVDLEVLYVRAPARRRGLGHALLAELVAAADATGATSVVSGPLPGARGVQRFLARAGFQAAAGYRVVTLAALRRRLAADPASPRTAPGGIARLVAVRRRVRGQTGELPVVPSAEATSKQVSRTVDTRPPESSSTTTS